MAANIFLFIFVVLVLSNAAENNQNVEDTVPVQPLQISAILVKFFDHANHEGESIDVYLEKFGNERRCYNFPADWNDRVSSVNTNDNCIHMFEHGDCQGRSKRVAPGTDGHRYVGNDFNDQVSSLLMC